MGRVPFVVASARFFCGEDLTAAGVLAPQRYFDDRRSGGLLARVFREEGRDHGAEAVRVFRFRQDDERLFASGQLNAGPRFPAGERCVRVGEIDDAERFVADDLSRTDVDRFVRRIARLTVLGVSDDRQRRERQRGERGRQG